MSKAHQMAVSAGRQADNLQKQVDQLSGQLVNLRIKVNGMDSRIFDLEYRTLRVRIRRFRQLFKVRLP